MSLQKIIRHQAFKDFAIIFLILGVTTVIFHVTNLDIALERYFYSPGKGWFLSVNPFWDFIYKFGIFPGYIFAFASLIMISVSYWNVKYLKFRKAAFMLVFTLVLGPGLLINLGFKDHWGRPRPRDIVEFDGKEQFVCVCVKGDSPEGKSFPCGHCSMGFYLAVPFLLLRKRRKLLAYGFLVAGIFYGCSIGVARMIAGGHFASDTIWAGGMVWIVALIGVYLFKTDKDFEPKIIHTSLQKKQARTATLIIGILLPVITLGLLLATPYFSKKYLTVDNQELSQAKCKTLFADLKNATVKISNDTCFESRYEVNGFGFPNSKLRGTWTLGDSSTYIMQEMGWFTELKNTLALKLPLYEKRNYKVHVDKGKIYCTLPDSIASNIFLEIESGDIFLTAANFAHFYLLTDEKLINNPTAKRLNVIHKLSDSLKCGIIELKIKNGKVNIE